MKRTVSNSVFLRWIVFLDENEERNCRGWDRFIRFICEQRVKVFSESQWWEFIVGLRREGIVSWGFFLRMGSSSRITAVVFVADDLILVCA